MSGENQIPRLEITALAQGGEGIARVEGMVWFVPFAYPGDVVSARILSRHRSWGRALPVDWLEPSPFRRPFIGGTEAPEQAYLWGCFDYTGQSIWKPRLAAETLRRVGGITVEPEFVTAPEPLRLNWRDRCTFHADRAGHPGYYLWHTHEIAPVQACPLASPAVNQALTVLARIGHTAPVTLTAHPLTGETMAWCSDRDLARLKSTLPFPVNSPGNPQAPAQFIMDGTLVVNGAFCQSSLLLNRTLRERVTQALMDAKTILDCYCGNGNLTRGVATRAKVTGFDLNTAAIEAARATVPGEFRVGDEMAMAEVLGSDVFDAVVLDPPRTGARHLATALAACRACRIVWVSCDTATLARDLKTVLAGGWNLRNCTVIDMFPYTPHAEILCVLER